MSARGSRQLVTFVLVFAAVIFGMVLAGGLEMTVPSLGDQATGPVETKDYVQGFPSFADLAEAVEPAVVSIQAATISAEAPQRRGGGMDPFEFFFGPRRGPGDGEGAPGEPERFRQDSGGSGFLISGDGLVVTNNHVVDGADQLRVVLNGREYPAEVKGTDPATDLALLQIDAGGDLPYLKLGDSEALRVADWVMAIGSPLSLDHSVTIGVVSAKGRSLGIADVSFENFIQTDAAINFGNSGGPLVNTRGEVIGIATAINYGAENIGFAVPVNTLKQILPQLRDTGRVRRGYLGIEVTNLDYPTAQAFGLESTEGALVGNVTPGSPAETAGVRHGDIILRVDDVPVEETRDLINYVSNQGPEATVELELLREGERVETEVKLAERPDDLAAAVAPQPDEDEGGIDWLGLQYQGITPGLRNMHGIPESTTGVLVSNVEPDSPLYDEGVRPGDIISEVNGQDVESVDAFEARVAAAPSGSYLRFYVERHNPRLPRPQYTFAVVRVP